MATKINSEKLNQYIGNLNSLHNEWKSYKRNPIDQGESGGGAITEMVKLAESLQDMQDAFELLIKNTLSYMRQRDASVKAKDAAAAAKIQK